MKEKGIIYYMRDDYDIERRVLAERGYWSLRGVKGKDLDEAATEKALENIRALLAGPFKSDMDGSTYSLREDSAIEGDFSTNPLIRHEALGRKEQEEYLKMYMGLRGMRWACTKEFLKEAIDENLEFSYNITASIILTGLQEQARLRLEGLEEKEITQLKKWIEKALKGELEALKNLEYAIKGFALIEELERDVLKSIMEGVKNDNSN